MSPEYWYVACATSQLENHPRHTRVLGKDLVIFRNPDGTPSILEDRCCHRGVQLSLGKITDGNLACPYHGWQYDGTGRCVHVPSYVSGTPIPQGFRVRAYSSVEQDHYVWVWMGTAEPPAPPPRLRGAQEYAWKQGVVEVKCSAELFVENMLDGAHPPFAHKGTHPGYFFNRINGFREYDYEVRVNDTGMVIFYPPASSESDPIPPTADSVVHFELPDRIYVLQRGQNFDFYNVLHIVPTDETSCRVEWLTRQRSTEPFVRWCDDEPKTLEQDRVLQESAQMNYSREGANFERSVPADYATLLSRKIIRIARNEDWERERGSLIQRRLVRVRQ